MKINTYIKASVVVLTLLSGSLCYGQQPFIYSQYMDNLGPLNPAWYLSDSSASVYSVVRKQWVGIDDAPATFVLNGHMPLPSMGAATGLSVQYDRYGPERLMEIGTFFAKAVRLSDRSYLATSMSVGYSRYQALYSQLDAADPAFRNDILENSATLGLGVMFYRPGRFFAGVSVPRLTMRELGIASKHTAGYFSTNYYLMAGYLGRLGDVFQIKPVLLLADSKKLPAQLDASVTLYIEEVLGLGVNYRTTEEMGAHVSFLPGNRLRFSYGYQFGTARYNRSVMGNQTHEVGFSYRFGKDVKKKLL